MPDPEHGHASPRQRIEWRHIPAKQGATVCARSSDNGRICQRPKAAPAESPSVTTQTRGSMPIHRQLNHRTRTLCDAPARSGRAGMVRSWRCLPDSELRFQLYVIRRLFLSYSYPILHRRHQLDAPAAGGARLVECHGASQKADHDRRIHWVDKDRRRANEARSNSSGSALTSSCSTIFPARSSPARRTINRLPKDQDV